MAMLGSAPLAAGLALAAVIIAYDLHHKGNPWSPLVMGLCISQRTKSFIYRRIKLTGPAHWNLRRAPDQRSSAVVSRERSP
jgi:hypothetical protein